MPNDASSSGHWPIAQAPGEIDQMLEVNKSAAGTFDPPKEHRPIAGVVCCNLNWHGKRCFSHACCQLTLLADIQTLRGLINLSC